MNRQGKKETLILVAAMCALLVFIMLSMAVGAVSIPLEEIWGIMTSGGSAGSHRQIFYFVRLPRTIAAVLAGAALACSGTILQTSLANPMCSPNIIGVNAGAGLFTIIGAAFFPRIMGVSTLFAFLGALLAAGIVYVIARKSGASRLGFVLSGIAISSLFSAFTDVLLTLVPDAKPSRVDFMIGSFSGVTMEHVGLAGPAILIGLSLALVFHNSLNLLSLGDSTASSLGLRVKSVRSFYLILAALLSGSAISFSGLIGFVGLLVPHICKRFIGNEHKYLLLLSTLLGGAFCLLCDILARVLFVPYEVPVGIIMSMIGSPFFIWLIVRGRRRKIID